MHVGKFEISLLDSVVFALVSAFPIKKSKMLQQRYHHGLKLWILGPDTMLPVHTPVLFCDCFQR